jgi:hypothetical protein
LYFPVVTPDGKQYLLLVADEYTRYAFVALLAKKSDAADHLLRIMKRAYVLQSTRIKNLRSDCGEEFQNTVMRLAKEQLGIADEDVPVYCHQSNDLIERLNYSIASIVRAVLRMGRLPLSMWGEAALYAVHMYNLSPHGALIAKKAASSIPHKLYVQDSDERMARLYQQLVLFGICCSIIQTGHKPQQVKKLDPRSVPGIIVGYGPSTKQYRVLVLHSQSYKVYIVRHFIFSARHFREYFARPGVPEMDRFSAVRGTTVLTCESVHSLPDLTAKVDLPLILVCAAALPTRTLSTGERCADDSVYANEMYEEAYEEAIELADEDEPIDANEREKGRSPDYDAMNSTVKQIEPNHGSISLDDLMRLQTARNKWLKIAAELNVRFHEGNVYVSMTNVSSDTDRVRDACAEEGRLIQELWNLKDVNLWAIDLDHPSFKVAMNGPNCDRWLEAFQDELNALSELDVHELVERPVNQKVMKGKVVCKVKRGADGSKQRYKTRHVGCGYDQTEGVDYFQHHVWEPTGQHATLRVLLVHAVTSDCIIQHIYISTAFLHGELSENETVYNEQPPIINDRTNIVWRLKKSLYGLKQSGRKWYEKLVSLLNELGFKKAGYYPALFMRHVHAEM